MRALVLDMTHGGDLIASRLVDRGYEVDCVDVYRNCPPDRREAAERRGARFLDAPEPIRYDLATLPAHCPISFMGEATAAETLSFSGMVSRLIDDGRFRIEVTGVKGKTSACYLIAKILHDSGRRVLLHSSRGEGPWTDGGHRVDRLASIAPPYLLDLAPGDYDAVVCEVSLGGSGKADVACITNILDDYGIAKNSRRASDAKREIFTDRGVNIVPRGEMGFWSGMRDGLVPYGGRVTAVSEPGLGRPLRVSVDYDGTSEIELRGTYMAVEYLDAMDLALEVCHAMGVPRDVVLRSLEGFGGVPGRGEILSEGGRTVVLERNPGISHVSIDRTLGCLRDMGALEGATVVVDPVSRKVCDKMDRDEIVRVVESYGVPLIFTEGDGSAPDVPEGAGLLVEFVKEAYQ